LQVYCMSRPTATSIRRAVRRPDARVAGVIRLAGDSNVTMTRHRQSGRVNRSIDIYLMRGFGGQLLPRAGFLQSQTRQEASTRKQATPTYGSRVVSSGGGTNVPTALFSCHAARNIQAQAGTCLAQANEPSFDACLSSLSTLPTKHLHREQMIVLPRFSSEIPIARLQFGQRMISRQAGTLGYSARHAGQAEVSGPLMSSPANPHVGQPAWSAAGPGSSPDETHPSTRSSSSAPHPGHGPVVRPRSLPHDGQTESTLMLRIVPQVSDETQSAASGFLSADSHRLSDPPPSGRDAKNSVLPGPEVSITRNNRTFPARLVSDRCLAGWMGQDRDLQYESPSYYDCTPRKIRRLGSPPRHR
jgi:hypothetical protein